LTSYFLSQLASQFIFIGLVYLYLNFSEKNLRNNIAEVGSTFKNQFVQINHTMDGSILMEEKFDSIQLQEAYHEFKNNFKIANGRDTSFIKGNCMIGETMQYVFMGILKIVKEKVQRHINNNYIDDSQLLFVPTKYIVDMLMKYFRVQDLLRSVVLGLGYHNRDQDLKEFLESDIFEELLNTIADFNDDRTMMDHDTGKDKDSSDDLIDLKSNFHNHLLKKSFHGRK
jgi:hypothetical protein